MDVPIDIKTYLESQSIIGSGTGWTCVLDWMPPEPDQVVVITASGGFAPHRRTDERQPTFQVRARSTKTSGQSAKDILESIFSALNGIANQKVNGNYYREILAQGEQLAMGRDDNNRFEYTQNYLARTL